MIYSPIVTKVEHDMNHIVFSGGASMWFHILPSFNDRVRLTFPASDIPVLKEVEAIVDPALFNMVRFVIAALPFLPFVLWARGDGKTRSYGIELGCWVSLGYLTQALGLLTSDAGRASFLSAFMVSSPSSLAASISLSLVYERIRTFEPRGQKKKGKKYLKILIRQVITVPLIDGLFGSTVPVLTWCGALVSLVGVCMLECGGSPPNVSTPASIALCGSTVFSWGLKNLVISRLGIS